MQPDENCVYVVKRAVESYRDHVDEPAPEIPGGRATSVSMSMLRSVFMHAGLDSDNFGKKEWNPLSGIVKPGDRVLIKPNWVSHRDPHSEDLSCLVTDSRLIEAVLHYLVKTNPAKITVGDAPIQDCDFESLMRKCRVREKVESARASGCDIEIRDFRLTKSTCFYKKKDILEPNRGEYCLFDLKGDSWLAPITGDGGEFRVTNYDPRILNAHHNRRSHEYLIARDAVGSDVVVNLPKLKTHKKAGVTGSLKNMVGINGFKEYLPHHRKGGISDGGDCYQKSGFLKRAAESFLDKANTSNHQGGRYLYCKLAGLASRLNGFAKGSGPDLDGSWHGNDTVWRTCLDIQRILHYGETGGSISPVKRRKVLSITDGIIAGEGEGPLSPRPVPLGMISMGMNAAAVEWVNCHAMHFDPRKIPLVLNSFAPDRWPLAAFPPEGIKVSLNGGEMGEVAGLLKHFGRKFEPSSGWKGHCEIGE